MQVSAGVTDFLAGIAALNCSDELKNGIFSHLSKILKEVACAHNRQGFYIEMFFVAVNVLAVMREVVLELDFVINTGFWMRNLRTIKSNYRDWIAMQQIAI